MQKQLARHLKTQRGATAIEYGLIVGLVALAIVVGAQALGKGISDGFTDLAKSVSTMFAKNSGT
ncbi:Flp family type IVb pilin [Cupriavidus pauculus]|uniref:Flp family type IVb pilin n=1 Tax=Cupriavidus pauculus TaxID=82633 RepID=UPI001EE175B7|nr:Flp family type IVb pilin [Cupriavidus pauculus]GJG94492.1 Flp family type IVb pilin [Cupriavidus pauculus]